MSLLFFEKSFFSTDVVFWDIKKSFFYKINVRKGKHLQPNTFKVFGILQGFTKFWEVLQYGYFDHFDLGRKYIKKRLRLTFFVLFSQYSFLGKKYCKV